MGATLNTIGCNGARPPLGRNWRLSPSDLTFLFDGCKNCFYHKIVNRVVPPRPPMASIFTHIDGGMKDCFKGQRIEAVIHQLPAGSITHSDGWVESAPIIIPGRASTVTLRGRFDTVVCFDDGSFGILDYKTSEPKPEYLTLYSRQLHAYAFATERPAAGALCFSPVTRLGLFVFQPRRFVHRGAEGQIHGYFGGSLHWMEIPRDDAAFLALLAEVVDLLERPEAPPVSGDCIYCAYRKLARSTGW